MADNMKSTSQADCTNQRQRRESEVHFSENITMQEKSSGYTTQKKIGPLGRRKLNRSIHTRQENRHAFSADDLSNGKAPPDSKGVDQLKIKRLGFRLSSPPNEKGRETRFTQKSPIMSLFNFGRSKLTRTSLQTLKRENRLDENGQAALHIAAQSNQVAKICELIRKGAVVNIKSSVDLATPLHMAARYNCPEAAKVLLQYGADVTDALTNGQTPLHVCCRRGYLKVVKVLIYNGKADVNSRDKDKTTPLHQATVKGDIDVCTFLVEHNADIRAKDINHVSPLMQAAKGGFKECVQYLLLLAQQLGIPIDQYLADKDNEGNTALHLTVGNRHIGVARSLIERGAPVNCHKTTNGFTPLHQAAIIGEEALAKMLIDKGAQTEATDDEQMTPLHRAALYNRVDTILLLIRQGLFLDSKDEDNFTPLLCAAWKGQTDAGRSLLRFGADIKAVDKEMKSCLHWAVEMQHLEFAEMLFEHGHGGEEILDWKERREQTAIHNASEVGNIKILQLLIKNGANLLAKDGEEKTPLHHASESGNLECVEALLQACPVPLNDDDIDDMTPLLLASENGHHRVVKFLMKMGADIGSRNDDSRSALALAAKNNEVQVLNVLLENNANVNAVDKDQNTPLHLCAQFGHTTPTELLLKSGADLRLQNIYGKYPLDLAIEHKQEAVAKALLSSQSWEVAMNNLDATGHTPMRRLIAVLPEAALQVMDQCVIRSHDDLNHPNLKVQYNYRYIDPGPDDITYDINGRRYFALETMVDFKREKLLAHKLSQTSLSTKWKSFARYFNYADFISYLTFVVVVSVYLRLNLLAAKIAARDADGCPLITNETDLDKLDDGYHNFQESDDGTQVLVLGKILVGIQIFIHIFIILRAIYEVADMLRLRLAYFKKMENYLHCAVLGPTFFFVFPVGDPPCDSHWIRGTLAVFGSWINFIFVLNRFDFFGLYVTMFFTTLKSLLKAMSVYIMFIIGFALAFFVCFQTSNSAFRDEWTSIVTTFVMTLGEINKSDLLDTDESLHPFSGVANALLVIFLFLMPMVLINLTIGISVGDIEQIMRSSYFKRFSLQVDLIFRIEKKFPRWLQRKVWLPTADFWPNKRNNSLLLKTIRRIIGASGTKFLRKSQEESSKEISLHDVMGEVNRHEATLSMLSVMVQQQGDILRQIADKHDVRAELENPLAVTSRSQGYHEIR